VTISRRGIISIEKAFKFSPPLFRRRGLPATRQQKNIEVHFFTRKNATFTFYFALCNNDKQLSTQKQIRMMKRTTILGLSLLVAGVASMTPVRVQAASMAVLVVGLETDAASDVFAAGIRYEFGQKGYTMITSPAVSAKLTELRNLHKQSQPVDTAGLAAGGRENSIDFVQLVVENDCTITIDGVAKSGREQLAQVVRCGTEQYSGRGYYRTQFIPLNPNLVEEFGGMLPVTGGIVQMLGSSYYVQLSDFYIGKYVVTRALWNKVMGISGGSNAPVVNVSWEDIIGSGGFLEKLNTQTGKNYRLPTEAEWEYAARGCNAGSCASYTYSGNNTIDDVAWYEDNCSSLQVVGQKLANGLGLYDMSGNVWEWCYDWYGSYGSNTLSTPAVNPTGASDGSARVVRGGSWASNASSSRVAARYSNPPSSKWGNFGFRLV
jgi:hypothetical protein